MSSQLRLEVRLPKVRVNSTIFGGSFTLIGLSGFALESEMTRVDSRNNGGVFLRRGWPTQKIGVKSLSERKSRGGKILTVFLSLFFRQKCPRILTVCRRVRSISMFVIFERKTTICVWMIHFWNKCIQDNLFFPFKATGGKKEPS